MKHLLSIAICFLCISTALAQPKDTSALLAMKAPANYFVQMNTSIGSFLLEVNKAWAPLAADRFYQLVSSGFYDDSRLFRSNIKYLQFGISKDSAVNAFWDRHPINDEPVIQKNTAGTISFATGGPNTRTTSVYFNKIDNPKLDTNRNGMAFPAFGKIVSGDSILKKVSNVYVDSVVFSHWDNINVKGNAYTDSVMPRLEKIEKMFIYRVRHPPTGKHKLSKTKTKQKAKGELKQ